MAVPWVVLAYVVCIFCQVAFAAYAMGFGFLSQRRGGKVDTETFITGRHTQNKWRIGWSFYAGAVGAWAVVTPGAYGAFAGIVGVVVYAITSGIPIILIAAFGEVITKRLPHVYSLSDFIGWRYGPVAKTLVCFICLFNMSIALTAEYTTIGALFSSFVGSVSYGIIISVGVLTLLYTAYGGLIVSIVTDQLQGIASILLAGILVVYVAVTFRQDIPSPLPENLGPNVSGYTSIFTLGASLACATVFSEAVWQRVWASADRHSLRFGAVLGCTLIIIVVFLSGFGGWLAIAGGLATTETDPNLYLFQLFSSQPNSVASLSSWVSLITVMLAAIMNEGAVDSIQNGLASSISSQWLKRQPLLYSRIAVVLVNIPLLVVGAKGYNVLSLFLIANVVACTAAIPVVTGLIDSLRGFITETSMIMGVVASVLCTTAAGIGLNWDPNYLAFRDPLTCGEECVSWDAGDKSTAIACGAKWAWYCNGYDWRVFLVAVCTSVGGMLVWATCAWVLRRAFGISGPGISGVLMRIPGMKHFTGSPSWTPAWRPCMPVEGADGVMPPMVGDVAGGKVLGEHVVSKEVDYEYGYDGRAQR